MVDVTVVVVLVVTVMTADIVFFLFVATLQTLTLPARQLSVWAPLGRPLSADTWDRHPPTLPPQQPNLRQSPPTAGRGGNPAEVPVADQAPHTSKALRTISIYIFI